MRESKGVYTGKVVAGGGGEVGGDGEGGRELLEGTAAVRVFNVVARKVFGVVGLWGLGFVVISGDLAR